MFKKQIFILVAFVVCVLALQYMSLGNFLTLETIKAQKYILKHFVKQNYLFSVFLFIAFFTLASFLSIPITIILNLLAGFLFGALPGGVYVNIGTTIGATLSFLLFRYFLGRYVRERYRDKLKKIDLHIKKYGYSYLLSLQILPATPTFLINSLAGLTSLDIWTFIWTTSLGILPGSLVYTFAGQELGKIESTKEVFTGPIIFALILLAVLAIMPILFGRFVKKDLRF